MAEKESEGSEEESLIVLDIGINYTTTVQTEQKEDNTRLEKMKSPGNLWWISAPLLLSVVPSAVSR